MSRLTYIAEEIKLKLVRLIDESEVLKRQCSELTLEKEALQSEIQSQKNTIRALEESNKMVKLAGTLVDSADSIPALKKKLNEYIREIDECIRFLSERQV